MPVAPVEGVHREERGEDPQFLVLSDLVLAQRLAVDQDGAIVDIGVFLSRGADCIDEPIDGGISIAKGLLDRLLGGLFINGGIARVVLGLPLRHDEVGFGQPGSDAGLIVSPFWPKLAN